MVNQALKKKIAYWAEKEENTRDRSVPDGSDNEEQPYDIPVEFKM